MDAHNESTPSPEGERPSARFRLRDHHVLAFLILLFAISAISATVFTFVLGLVADLTAVIQVASIRGVLAIALFSIGIATIIWQVKFDSSSTAWKLPLKARLRTWIGRITPIACIVVSALLAIPPAAGAIAKNQGVPGVFAGGPATVIPGCPPTDANQVDAIYSHARLATEEGQDVDVEVAPNGYVQQRFFAASDYISSIAVIVSRPPVSDQPAFDRFRIGAVRLSLYETDDQGKNTRPIPIKLIETDGDSNPAGVMMQAGENHKNTVFRICPTKLAIGSRYAFRVTNEEPGVVLAFSLSSKEGPRTSMDIIGTPSGRKDRTKINYSQVAGYVCSLTNC